MFSFVQADIKSNIHVCPAAVLSPFLLAKFDFTIQGVRSTFTSKPEQCQTLETLVHSEADASHKHGTGCLRRLLRHVSLMLYVDNLTNLRSAESGLLFTYHALQEARANPHEEKLQPSFSRAYDTVLRHHHGFAIRTIVQVALRACPYRRDFYSRISQGGSQEKLDEELARWLVGLNAIVGRMVEFYEKGGHGNI